MAAFYEMVRTKPASAAFRYLGLDWSFHLSETAIITDPNSGAAIKAEYRNRGKERLPLGRRLRQILFHCLMRWLTGVQNFSLIVAGIIGGRTRVKPKGNGWEILLTGRFESDNWALSHLRPLASSDHCLRVWVVTTWPLPPLSKVRYVYPPGWLVSIVGAVLARTIVFTLLAIKKRPDIVGGFHLLANGLVAGVLAKLIGARAMYFCVGGQAEMLDGGVHGEPGPFKKMETPDRLVERRLLRAVAACDLIITMGSGAKSFFHKNHIYKDIHIVSGGINEMEFHPNGQEKDIDILLVGRLAEIKRIDVLLRAVKHLAAARPDIRVVIAGDGPLRPELEKLACELGIHCCINFVGHQKNIGEWMNRSRLFILTSDSEGLSLALMEAMMSGLPAVVSKVGDLSDLVRDGENGYLVQPRRPREFAERIWELLDNPEKYAAFSLAARQTAMKYETSQTIQRWNRILAYN